MPALLISLAPIGLAIMPLVDVVKRVVKEKLNHELDYTETLLTVVALGVILALTHTYYPTWPMPLQVAAGGVIISLDSAAIVKLVYRKGAAAPEA